EQGRAPGQHASLVYDVDGELRRRVLERYLDGLDARADRFCQALGNLTLADHDLLSHALHQVAPPDLHHAALTVLRHAGRTYLLLDPLGAALADEEIMVAADIGNDRLVHLIAPDPNRSAIDDAAKRQHRHLGRPA